MYSSFNLTPDIPSAIYTSHLNILTNNDEQTKPLWGKSIGRNSSTNNCEQEYYEIEILRDKGESTELPFEKSMDDVLNMNKYLCHICNIEVPKTYMKEHNRSVKHKTCYDIASLALERTKLQMQLDGAESRKLEILDTYFCDPCAAVVLNSDKEGHEKTKTHKVALKHDELLGDLLKIYSDIGNVEAKSEIDELELLQQRIEAEALEDESQNTETADEGVGTVDLKAMQEEVLNVLKDELKTALDSEIQSALDYQLKTANNEMSEVREFINRMKLETDRLEDRTNALHEKMTHQHNRLNNLAVDDAAPKTSRNARNKAYKKYQIQKKKERFNRCPPAAEKDINIFSNIDSNKSVHEATKTVVDTETANVSLDEKKNSSEEAAKVTTNDNLIAEKDASEEVVKEISLDPSTEEDSSLKAVEKEHNIIKASSEEENKVDNEVEPFGNRNGPLKQLANKIETIMSKYFDSNRTVAALNGTEGEQTNKDSKETNKNLEKKNQKDKKKSKSNKEHVKGNQEQIQNEEVIKQDIDKEQNESIEQNNNEKNIEHQNEDKTRNNNNNNEPNESIEENNNKTVEQNNNKSYEQNKENIELKEDKQEQKTKNKDSNKGKVKEHKKQDIINTNLISTKQSNSKRNKPQAPSFNLVYYLKDISRRCETKPIHTVEAITDTIVQITCINGDKFKVLVNNFHSFHTKASDIYCKVCESPNVRRPEWHIAENEHRAKVMIPINDLNGIRQLDDIWSHCMLCNDLTKNVDFHLQSLLHKNKVKHCLVELGTNNSDTKACDDKKTNTNKGPVITAMILKNNLVMTNKNYLKCIVCDVIVNYDLSSVQQHITSFDHLNYSEQQQNENKLVDVDEDILYCIGCDMHILKTENVPHCNGKRHKKLLLELLAKHGEELATATDETEIVLESISQSVKKQDGGQIEGSELICFVCNIIIYSVDEHTDSFDHKKSYLTYLEANKLNEIEADTFYCIPCNTVITIDYLMSHCTSKKHRLKLKNFTGQSTSVQEKSDKTSPPSILSALQLTCCDRTMRMKVLYQFREMTDPTKLLCTICDEEVVYSRKLAEHHISTLDHVVAFNLMMLWNKIKKRDDKYFCDICRSDMTYFSEIAHVLGKQHADNLAKEPKGTVYEYDRTLVTHAYAMSHKVGNRARPTSIVSVCKPVVQESEDEC